ncbi:MAG: sulfite exporter TauE/SafE family protein [Acidobacteria bacterium]|nr:sulfite exporter TauE/SafE family protein [Acidobacteriota bacterium]
MRAAILAALAAFTLAYATVLVAALREGARQGSAWIPTATHLGVGFVTNFFDTLGIGSFAPTTAIFKFRRLVPDHLIPGTLNAGHTLPVILQAFLYIAVIEVDVATLLLLIGSATVGAWFGAGLVAGLARRTVQLGMGGALLVAAVGLLMRQLDLFPSGGDSLQLRNWRLAAGMLGNFAFGAISTLGIGFYAPCMTMVSLLGMNPVAAFPIMMGSGAFLMPVASARFVRRSAFLAPAAVGLTIGGLAGVPLAAFVVKSLELTVLRWLVMVVVVYAAVVMVRSARQSPAA